MRSATKDDRETMTTNVGAPKSDQTQMDEEEVLTPSKSTINTENEGFLMSMNNLRGGRDAIWPKSMMAHQH
jgi:hypothetical protein